MTQFNKIKIDWQPNKALEETLHNQILNYFIKNIMSGEWLIGQVLPSQRQLADIFNVNRSTVVAVISELTSLGIVEPHIGKGTQIANNTWSLYSRNTTPEWDHYINAGMHRSNLPTIQTINTLEFNENIIRLSTGEMAPELFPHKMMRTVLDKIPTKALSLNYLEPLGLLELREALSEHLKTHGINAAPDQVLIVSGSLQALQLISLSLLKKGSTIYLEEPSYAKSLNVFQSNSLNMVGIPMDKEGICPWLHLGNRLDKDAILYTIPTYHNPTNHVMSLKRRHELLSWSKSLQLPIIEDDAYRELWFDEVPPPPLKSFDDTGNVLYLGSASKSLAPGLRIGWVVGPKPVVNRLSDIKMQADYGASSLSQWVLTEWITSGLYQEHLTSFRLKLKSKRDYLDLLLKEEFSEIATWQLPTGGYYIWLTLNKKIDTSKLFDQGIKENILINPGYIYSFKNNVSIRLSYAYAKEEDLKTGIKKLSQLIKKL